MPIFTASTSPFLVPITYSRVFPFLCLKRGFDDALDDERDASLFSVGRRLELVADRGECSDGDSGSPSFACHFVTFSIARSTPMRYASNV